MNRKEFEKPEFDMVLLVGQVVVCSIKDGSDPYNTEDDNFDEALFTSPLGQ